MPPDAEEAFSRDILLGGLPARRASTLLYAIERRTSVLARRARNAMAAHFTPTSEVDRDRAFFEAVGAGRTERIRPSPQDLERYASRWADLVPPDASLRASVARLMGEAYALRAALVPGIRAALGLDDPAVAAAYERLHGRPLETIWARELPLRSRLAWWRSHVSRRIEGMPPAVTAFALTFTETVGVGILVLPVAIAGLGVIPGLILLVSLGLLNLVTVGALVESITRSGPQRYGTAYLGRLVADLLGSRASVVMALALLVLNLVTLLTLYLTFGSALAGSTGVPDLVWIGLLFAVDVAIIRRGSLDATVATAILVGVANVALIASIAFLAVPHVEGANLSAMTVPFMGDAPLDAGVLELVFGVVLMAYFGHTSAANAAKVVLDRDPSGHALLMGNLAAFVAVILIYGLVVTAAIGAVGPDVLAVSAGTLLTPLAAVVGPSIDILGAAYVLLAVGIGSIYFTLGLHNQVLEVLPSVRARDSAAHGRLLDHAGVRMALGVAPAAGVLLVATALVVTGQASIVAALGAVGVLTVPLLGGIFPMLLVLAARRRGELVPGRVIEALGSRAVAVGVISVFSAAVLLHGLVIWTQPLDRVAAIVVGVLMLGVVAMVSRRGAFRPRSVLELRRTGPNDALTLVNAGRHVRRLDDDTDDEDGAVIVPDGASPELLAWAHEVTPEGDSVGLAGRLTVADRPGGQELLDGRATTILDKRPARVRILLAEERR